jgi:SAM-dependent methyltransferase
MILLVLGSCTNEQPVRYGASTTPGGGSDDALLPPNAQLTKPSRRPAHALFVEYVPTPQDVVEEMLDMTNLTKNDVLYDLGCGDGRILVTAAKQYGCRAYGCDIDRLRVREARENAGEHDVAHLVTVERKNVLDVDLQEATVVALYLSPELLTRLLPQLRQLRPGSRIVSHDFPIPRIPPEKTRKMTSREDGREHMIYLWTSPLPTAP